MDIIRGLNHLLLLAVLFALLLEAARFLSLSFRSNAALRAENLFLRRELALYAEWRAKARRANDCTCLAIVCLSRFFAWKDALTIVKPGTLVTWHRKGFGFFWCWKSKRRGRPRLPMELRRLIVQMAERKVTWGEERIAAELLLKLGIRVSPRTVRRYMPESDGTDGRPRSDRRMTFVRNHAKATLACDFFVTVTANFRILYVLVIMEIGSRRIIHFNVTDHPTSEWTWQQFRVTIQDGEAIRFLIHDRDSIYSAELDLTLGAMGVKILKTPVRAPTAKRIVNG